jgi:hypothetical protein
MKPIKLFPIIILILTLGCQPASATNTNTVSTQTPQSFTFTPYNTSTKIQTPTATPNPLFHSQCPEIVTEIPQDLELEGKIVLEGNPDNWGLFFFDPTNNNLTKIPNYNTWYYSATSPNGKHIAYQLYGDNNKRYLAIADASNNILKKIPWQDSWYEILRWINDEQLSIASSVESSGGQEKRMVLVTPFKDKLEYINLDGLGYPDYNGDLLREPWVGYDPTLERVVYLTWTQHILLNTQTNEILATLSGSGLGSLGIDWSQDGEFVAIDGYAQKPSVYSGHADELYVISRDGEVNPMNLTDFFGAGVKDYSSYGLSIEQPKWSPNGRFIAFWESDNLTEDEDWKLAILDVKTKEVTSYCSQKNIRGVFNTPVWSPNSQQIIVTGHNYTVLNSDPVYMIDIPNNVAIEIARNASPVGWMISKP